MRGLRKLLGIAVFGAGLAGPLAANASAADTYSVPPGGDDTVQPCTGSAPSFSCPNLRSAVATAEGDNNSTIQLQAGTYKLSTGHLSINPGANTLTIAGAGASQTTIQQTGAFRVMNLNSGTMTVSGLTITGGTQAAVNGSCPISGEVSGGGILNAGTLTLSGVTVTGNSATGSAGAGASSGTAGAGGFAFGGGICSTGSLTLNGTTVSANTLTAGAGGTGTSTATGGIAGSADGAGIFSSGALTVRGHSLIEDNHAVGGRGGDGGNGGGNGGQGEEAAGGGVYAGGAFTMTDSTVTANTMVAGNSGNAPAGNSNIAGVAGGSVFIASTSPSATIDSSQITDGIATGGNGGNASGTAGEGNSGGAGLSVDAPLTVTDSTISGNTGAGGSAGSGATLSPAGNVNGAGVDAEGGPVNLIGTTIANNHASAGPTGTTASASGVAWAGGLLVRATTTILNSTITGNAAAADTGGTAIGGGIDARGGNTHPMTLASVTLVGNSAASATPSAGNGGNLYVSSGGISIADTIISGGSSSSTSNPLPNCDGSVTDGGRNLESTTPSQCGFSAANGDLIGSDPRLGSLASNGGPTQTMALGSGSPAIHAGGQCTDPTNGGAALQTDQRGLRRHNPCDIGAFEGQSPGGAPTVTGTPAVGRALTCSTSSITGDGPLSFSSYQWLRNGVPISAATTSTYQVANADLAQQLACRVTATDPFGSATLTSASVTVSPVPKISGLKQSHKKWRRGGKLATIARKRAPVGDKFTFKLSADAKLTLTFTHKLHGRKRTAGKITFKNARAGKHRIKFQGRLSRHKKLRTGTYTLKITATNPSGHSTSKGITFTIVA